MSQKSKLERTIGAPAEMLDKTITQSVKINQKVTSSKLIKRGRDYWHALGPGLTTGASDDDPSGIATYSQTGAQYGFKFLWTTIISFPLMAISQEMCARIGLVTGRGLAGNIRLHFSRKALYACTLLLFIANAVNIGADLGAMAKAVQLGLPDINFGLLVVFFGLFSLGLQIFTPYARYAKYLKWLAMVLLAYIFSALLAHLNWGDIARHAIIPSMKFNRDSILILCAILGTTISPYLFFWQTSSEVEEQISLGNTNLLLRKAAGKEHIRAMRADVWSGMFLSSIVMFAIIAACGAILFPQGITHIATAAQAAEALRPFAGNATYVLFGVGIIGTGLLAIPVLAGSSSYAIAESFHWAEGLSRKLKRAYGFYGIIIISMIIGIGMNFIGIDPIKA
jgi:NRAMP (natural resistance-associated macrophage protein)-like metal ion transporter